MNKLNFIILNHLPSSFSNETELHIHCLYMDVVPPKATFPERTIQHRNQNIYFQFIFIKLFTVLTNLKLCWYLTQLFNLKPICIHKHTREVQSTIALKHPQNYTKKKVIKKKLFPDKATRESFSYQTA